MMVKYDLSEFIPKDIKVFSGRKEGYELRERLNLDEFDDSLDTMVLTVPEYIYSITPGFFFALFGDSVRKLGKEKFIDKYRFGCSDVIRNSIDEFIISLVRIK